MVKTQTHGSLILLVVVIVAIIGLAMNFTGMTGAASKSWRVASSAPLASTAPIATSPTVTSPVSIFTCATCQSLNKNCGGPYSDGCGGSLNCGVCKPGDQCVQGVCLPPGQCAYDIDCGAQLPSGTAYCSGNDVMQDVILPTCQNTNIGFWTPGSTCYNQIRTFKVHSCSSGTTCKNGECFKSCKKDRDCSSQNLGLCTKKLCTKDSDNYLFCYDRDSTMQPKMIGDPSLKIPSSVLLIEHWPTDTGPASVGGFTDQCGAGTYRNTLSEAICLNSATPSSVATSCPNINPTDVCNIYNPVITPVIWTYAHCG